MIDRQKKTINVWWSKTPSPGNFGDIITPWLIHQMTGYTAIHSMPSQNKNNKVLLGIGSIIDKTNGSTVVWGSGCMTKETIPSLGSSYLAVRGPITRDMIQARGIYCPPIFGDPALLLPKYYNPTVSKKYRLGIVPHYVDYDQVVRWYSSDPTVKIIYPINHNILDVVNQMLECESIVSSSLHGLIVPNAYGIPTSWVKFSTKLTGDADNLKFRDYFSSVEIKHSHAQIFEKIPVDDLYKLKYYTIPDLDLEPLLKSFPIQ